MTKLPDRRERNVSVPFVELDQISRTVQRLAAMLRQLKYSPASYLVLAELQNLNTHAPLEYEIPFQVKVLFEEFLNLFPEGSTEHNIFLALVLYYEQPTPFRILRSVIEPENMRIHHKNEVIATSILTLKKYIFQNDLPIEIVRHPEGYLLHVCEA